MGGPSASNDPNITQPSRRLLRGDDADCTTTDPDGYAPEVATVRVQLEVNREAVKDAKKQASDLKKELAKIEDNDEELKQPCECFKSGRCDSDLERLGIGNPADPAINTTAACLAIVTEDLRFRKADRSRSRDSERGYNSRCVQAASTCSRAARNYTQILRQLDTINADLISLQSEATCLDQKRRVAVAACPQCAMMDAARPRGFGDFALGALQALAPTMSMGIQSWMYGKSLNAQAGYLNQALVAYDGYLKTCATQGIPCNSPFGGGPQFGGMPGVGMPFAGQGGFGGMGGFGGGGFGGMPGGGQYPMVPMNIQPYLNTTGGMNGPGSFNPLTLGYGYPVYPLGSGFSPIIAGVPNYPAGSPSYLNPYIGLSGNGQFNAMGGASGQFQMQNYQNSFSNPNLMSAQQQAYEAMQRYQQSILLNQWGNSLGGNFGSMTGLGGPRSF